MKPSEMKHHLYYTVTKGNSDGTIEKGDLVAIDEGDGALGLLSKGGWYDKEDWQRPGISDFEVELLSAEELLESMKNSETPKNIAGNSYFIYSAEVIRV